MKLIEQFTRLNQIAILIDPEKCQTHERMDQLIEKIHFSKVDYVFVGGSTVTREEFEFTTKYLKNKLSIPIVIFPGSSNQVSKEADAILLLNLISGRNPDFLIGHHIQAAQSIIDSNLEVISTSYLLIDGGNHSSVAYVSQTTPIPNNQYNIAYNTALAGKLIGHQVVFMDAGSGAKSPIKPQMIRRIKELSIPVIIGGGIRSISELQEAHKAGANIVVIGNKIEEDINFLLDIHSYIGNKH